MGRGKYYENGVIHWENAPRLHCIVELAAEGLGNREIAAKLCIAPNTVEGQLGKLRKIFHDQGLNGSGRVTKAKIVRWMYEMRVRELEMDVARLVDLIHRRDAECAEKTCSTRKRIMDTEEGGV
jgi:hypothetical protein